MGTLRRAYIRDVAVLITHHDTMFREIYTLDGRNIEPGAFTEMCRAYREKLLQQLSDGTCVAWVIDTADGVVASAAITFTEAVPIPTDPQCRVALVHSVYTEPMRRRRGYAERLLVEAMRFCSEMNVRRIDLVASDVGRLLYEKLGFKINPSAMRYVAMTTCG